MSTMNPEDILYLVVHCSASPQGRGDDARTIHRWHKENRWAGIGYHYVILEDGTVQAGRPEYWPGGHVKGKNDCSIGICLIGMGGDATPKQLAALREKLDRLKYKYPDAEVVGHSDLDPQGKPNCPGFSVKGWYKA